MRCAACQLPAGSSPCTAPVLPPLVQGELLVLGLLSLLLVAFEPYLLQICITCSGSACAWDCPAPPYGADASAGAGSGSGRRRALLESPALSAGGSNLLSGGRRLLASGAGADLGCLQAAETCAPGSEPFWSQLAIVQVRLWPAARKWPALRAQHTRPQPECCQSGGSRTAMHGHIQSAFRLLLSAQLSATWLLSPLKSGVCAAAPDGAAGAPLPLCHRRGAHPLRLHQHAAVPVEGGLPAQQPNACRGEGQGSRCSLAAKGRTICLPRAAQIIARAQPPHGHTGTRSCRRLAWLAVAPPRGHTALPELPSSCNPHVPAAATVAPIRRGGARAAAAPAALPLPAAPRGRRARPSPALHSVHAGRCAPSPAQSLSALQSSPGIWRACPSIIPVSAGVPPWQAGGSIVPRIAGMCRQPASHLPLHWLKVYNTACCHCTTAEAWLAGRGRTPAPAAPLLRAATPASLGCSTALSRLHTQGLPLPPCSPEPLGATPNSHLQTGACCPALPCRQRGCRRVCWPAPPIH